MKSVILRRMVAFTTALILYATGTLSSEIKTYQESWQEIENLCQGRFKNKSLTKKELKRVLHDHRVWLETYMDVYEFQQAKSDPRRADLCMAKLDKANLSGADLFRANLSGATLTAANLSGAGLHGADLNYAIFEPKDLPEIDGIAYAMNLSQMYYEESPQALVKLRKAFKEAGYYQQEREVTCAIQRSVTYGLAKKDNFASLFEALFRHVFFDFTCRWGAAPGRALLILLALIPVFAFPYAITLFLPGKSGIWCKWADDRVRLDLGTKEATRLHVGWLQAPVLGFYFSILSAFNIGWRELNVGNWIQRIQAKEYTLKASGWVRTVSGVQSLTSVYLLAIWALTYFGRPFE